MSETQSYKKETNSCGCDCSMCEDELAAAMWMAGICAVGLIGLAAITIASAWA